ncbi:MAG: hypothetical protein N2647_05555 [Thermodesulfovibrio sp.]|nr:hypothetical protein [Thermodesulfovibrio sp.]
MNLTWGKPLITVLIIVFPGFIFGMLSKPTEMGLAIVAGAISATFFNLDKIQRFKGAGFEAEMKKAVDEAYATVDNLKIISTTLVNITLKILTYEGRWGGMSLKSKFELLDDLNNVNKSLSIEDTSIKLSLNEFHRQLTWDFLNWFTAEYCKNTPYDESINKQFNDMLKKKNTYDFPSEADILKVINKSKEELSEKARECLIDYIYYKEHKKPRRWIVSE